MKLHVRIVSIEELRSPLIGPPIVWEGDLDYDGSGDDDAICGWLYARLNRYTGDGRQRWESVGYYRPPLLSVGDLVAFVDAAVPPIDREVKLYRLENDGEFIRLSL